MVLLHAGDNDIDWVMPSTWGQGWSVLIDTCTPDEPADQRQFRAREHIAVHGRSLLVLRRIS
jgi:hypothetical protein